MLENLNKIISILDEYKITEFEIYKKPMFMEIFVEVNYKWNEIFVKILYEKNIKEFVELLNYYNQ